MPMWVKMPKTTGKRFNVRLWSVVRDTADGWSCRWICRTLLKEQVLMVGNFEERGNGSVGHRYYAFAHM